MEAAHHASDEDEVEHGRVERAQRQVGQEQQEVAQVVVAHAAAGEGAVVVAAQDARPAGGAVPGARRRSGLAG